MWTKIVSTKIIFGSVHFVKIEPTLAYYMDSHISAVMCWVETASGKSIFSTIYVVVQLETIVYARDPGRHDKFEYVY